MRLYYVQLGQVRNFVEYDALLTLKSLAEARTLFKTLLLHLPLPQFESILPEQEEVPGPSTFWLLTSNNQLYA
jgi:hypothetical protein